MGSVQLHHLDAKDKNLNFFFVPLQHKIKKSPPTGELVFLQMILLIKHRFTTVKKDVFLLVSANKKTQKQ